MKQIKKKGLSVNFVIMEWIAEKNIEKLEIRQLLRYFHENFNLCQARWSRLLIDTCNLFHMYIQFSPTNHVFEDKAKDPFLNLYFFKLLIN